MDDIYILGIVIQLAVSIIRIIYDFNTLFSLQSVNFKKVDIYYSPLSCRYENDKDGFWSYFFYFIIKLIIQPVFSWLSLVCEVLHLVKNIKFTLDLPNELKLELFKLKNTFLSRTDVISLDLKIKKITDIKSITFNESFYHLNIGDKEWPHYIDINPLKKEFVVKSYTPDRTQSSIERVAYRINGFSIEIKTIKLINTYLNKSNTEVCDGVIIKNESEQSSDVNFKAREKQNSDLSKKIEWTELTEYRLSIFIYSFHSELLENSEFKKYIREKIEKIRNGVFVLINDAKELGVEISEDNDKNIKFTYPQSFSQKEKDDFYKKYLEDVSLKKYNITFYELTNHSSILRMLSSVIE